MRWCAHKSASVTGLEAIDMLSENASELVSSYCGQASPGCCRGIEWLHDVPEPVAVPRYKLRFFDLLLNYCAARLKISSNYTKHIVVKFPRCPLIFVSP
jgi:hypothetical protein